MHMPFTKNNEQPKYTRKKLDRNNLHTSRLTVEEWEQMQVDLKNYKDSQTNPTSFCTKKEHCSFFKTKLEIYKLLFNDEYKLLLAKCTKNKFIP